jgi:hypothetical protein
LEIEFGGLNYFEEIFWRSVFFCVAKFGNLANFFSRNEKTGGEICDFMDFLAIF